MGCYVVSGKQSGMLLSLSFFLNILESWAARHSEWNLSVHRSCGKNIKSNKVLCSKLVEKILIWLTASLRSFSENVISEAVCDLQYASSTSLLTHLNFLTAFRLMHLWNLSNVTLENTIKCDKQIGVIRVLISFGNKWNKINLRCFF